MRGMNRCTIMGNLGADVEVKQLSPNFRAAFFSVAVNSSYTDRKTGELRTQTNWVRCKVTNPGILDAVIEPGYMTKGSRILVEGPIVTEQYEKDGRTVYNTNVVVNTLTLLGNAKDRAANVDAKVTRAEPALTPETADADVPF